MTLSPEPLHRTGFQSWLQTPNEFLADGPRSPRVFRGPTGATCPGPHKNGLAAKCQHDSSKADEFTGLDHTVKGQDNLHGGFAVCL